MIMTEQLRGWSFYILLKMNLLFLDFCPARHAGISAGFSSYWWKNGFPITDHSSFVLSGNGYEMKCHSLGLINTLEYGPEIFYY